MKTLPKFPNLKKSDTLYIDSGLLCNGHWLLDINWLLSLKSKLAKALQKEVHAVQLGLVTSRLLGTNLLNIKTRDLSDVMNINFEKYSEFKITCENLKTYAHKGKKRKGIARLLDKSGRYLIDFDLKYFRLLILDLEAKLLIRDALSPVVLVDGKNKILAILMPMRETCIDSENFSVLEYNFSKLLNPNKGK
jgi:hypothetical protein